MKTRSRAKRRILSPGEDAVRKTMLRTIELVRARQKQSDDLQDYVDRIDPRKRRRR